MRSRLLRTVLLAALGCPALPAVASAQLYTWRDAAGNLIVSATPREGTEETYEVVNVREGIRTTTQPSQALNRRAGKYESLIEAYASHHQVRPDLVRAVGNTGEEPAPLSFPPVRMQRSRPLFARDEDDAA